MNFKKNILSFLSIGLVSTALLTSCIHDDYLDMDGFDKVEYAEPSLVFDFNLAPYDDGSTTVSPGASLNHAIEWENFIDPSKIRVLFFDMEGYFLFEADQRFIQVLDKGGIWHGGSDTYRVVIPKRDLYPEVGRAPGQNDAVRKAIEEDGFKVAVLANWPSYIEGDRIIDPETKDEVQTDKIIDLNINFQWEPKPESGADNRSDKSHISYLSHCAPDNVYGKKIDGQYYDAFSNVIYEDNEYEFAKMGVYTKWVSNLFKSQDDAENFIREGRDENGDMIEGDVKFLINDGYTKAGEYTYEPYSYERTVDDANTYKHYNIWRVFNFSAGKSCAYNKINDDGRVNPYWERRNTNILIAQMKDYHKFDWSKNNEFSITYEPLKDTLFFTKNRNLTYSEYNGSPNSGFVHMPQVLTDDEVTNLITDISKYKDTKLKMENGGIRFKAYGEGILRIRAKGDGKIVVFNKNAKIVTDNDNTDKVQYLVERHIVTSGNETAIFHTTSKDYYYKPTVDANTPFKEGMENEEGVEYLVDPGNSEYLQVYIAAVDGDVDIYEIEYMRARHIFDSGRNSIMPSDRNPIPMYGVQNFDPIGAYLKLLNKDETFNMSDDNENPNLEERAAQKGITDYKKYNFKNVHLLRSLAKVEILFDYNVFKNNMPEHVMLRSMNRTARCEPMDVINPTEWIWYGNGGENTFYPVGDPRRKIEIPDAAKPNEFVGIAKEFENIKDYGPIYNPGAGTNVGAYRQKLAWFNGFWTEQASSDEGKNFFWRKPWNWNNISTTVPQTTSPYPRIFNSRIDRSDYCRLHKTTPVNGYIRYIAYIPEKNIDDADKRANLSASPKVCHIEVRFKNMNDVMNFDDNNHYRIYFTNYTDNGEYFNSIPRDDYNSGDYDAAERLADYKMLKHCQPIVRNCYYKFVVNSINNKQIGVNMTVCGAANRTGQTFVIK